MAVFLGHFYELRAQGILAEGFTRKKVSRERNDGFEGATHLSRPASFLASSSSLFSSVLKSFVGVTADFPTADFPTTFKGLG